MAKISSPHTTIMLTVDHHNEKISVEAQQGTPLLLDITQGLEGDKQKPFLFKGMVVTRWACRPAGHKLTPLWGTLDRLWQP